MLDAVRNGRPGTAMKSFRRFLDEEEIVLVVDFVRLEFIQNGAQNTRYHTAENGWPDHRRYQQAYPFALGELALDTPDRELTSAQLRGKRLFLTSCISCHDRARVRREGPIWDSRAVSYPRRHYSHRQPATDALSGATPYAKHDVPPVLQDLSTQQKQGERLYQENCAFCHAADGTGRNWIGRFLEPHPRDLTDPRQMTGMTQQRLKKTILEGLPGTGMPAWGMVLNDTQVTALIAYIRRAFYEFEEQPPEKVPHNTVTY